jgi:hypothetical protein
VEAKSPSHWTGFNEVVAMSDVWKEAELGEEAAKKRFEATDSCRKNDSDC